MGGRGGSLEYAERGRGETEWGGPYRASTTRSIRQRRGPKGYQRSDERIREEIIDRLIQHTDLDLAQMEVTVDKGEVTLSGTVEDRQTKHRMEDLVDSVWGVKEIHNNLRVRSGGGDGAEGGRVEPESGARAGATASAYGGAGTESGGATSRGGGTRSR